MTKASLTHVARPTRNITAAIAFYRDFVGLQVVHQREDDGVQVAWLGERAEGNSFVIVLIGVPPLTDAVSHFADHLGYDVPSRADVDAIAERAAERGILTVPATDGGEIIGYYCMVEDPDGNLVEFSHGQPIEIPAATPDPRGIPVDE